MPIMYLSYTEGAFTPKGLDYLAAQITQDAIELEKLPLTDWVRSTTLIYSVDGHNQRIDLIALSIQCTDS